MQDLVGLSPYSPTSEVSSRFRRKPVIGLVGGVGSGKSTVARLLSECGAAVIDSDRLGHEVLQRPDVVEQLRRWWGDGVLRADGVADRQAIGRIVFDSPRELERLEGLVHPLIDERRREILLELEGVPTVKAVVLDAPKLLEAGLKPACDVVVFVDAPRDQRVRRVAETRGWSEEELNRREALQFSLDRKREMSDVVIVNHSDIASLRRDVEQLLTALEKSNR